MKGELVSHTACSLFRRAGAQVGFVGPRGQGLKGSMPDLAATLPFKPWPRAHGSLEHIDWKWL